MINLLRSDREKGINTTDELVMKERSEYFGDNRLKPPSLNPFIMFVYKQTKDFCIRILALAAVIMFLLAFVSEDPFESIV